MKSKSGGRRSGRGGSAAAARGLVWFEVLIASAVVGVVGALLVVASSRTRAQASLGQTMTNLRVIGDAFASYGEDSQDRVLGYSWTKGNCPSQYPDINHASDNISAAACQAIDIARRRSGNEAFTRNLVGGWAPQFSYWHWIVADYLNLPLPSGVFQSPEHAALLALASDPANWRTGNAGDRFPLSTSYQISAGFWGGPDKGADAINQDGLTYGLYSVPGNALSASRTLFEVTYPAAKALVFDSYQWHFGPRIGFFMYEEARVPILAADGSLSVRAGSNTNPGWKPTSPTNKNPSLIGYDPVNAYPTLPAPPTLSGAPSDTLKGRLRYTRGGLGGRDFDGPEVP